jgi:hypothetical protein
MSDQAATTFQVKQWEEKPIEGMEGGPKLTRASISKSYRGDIEGEGSLEYLMIHREDGSANFVGLERVVGRVGGRTGSFVLQHTGSFEGGTAKATWFVVEGSGTGELRGLRGEGGFASAHAEHYPITFNYEFQ